MGTGYLHSVVEKEYAKNVTMGFSVFKGYLTVQLFEVGMT